MRFQKILLLFLISTGNLALSPVFSQNVDVMNNDKIYRQAWMEIDSLEKQGLVRSALEKTEALYARAAREGNTPQLVKTILYRGKYTQDLEENGQVAAIGLLRRELANATFPLEPVLQSLLATAYRDYLGENRWDLQDRTSVDQDSLPDDIQTWTIADFEYATAKAFLASVADPRLQSVLIEGYAPVLSEGKNTKGLRNSLADLLFHRALKYFSDSRSFLTRPVYRFYLDQAEAFADVQVFCAFPFPDQDPGSLEYQALKLFQLWLKQKADERNAAALLDADLMRLEFVHEKTILVGKDSLFSAALLALEAQFPNEPGVAEAMYHRARLLVASGNRYDAAEGDKYRLDKRAAKAIAEEALKRFPGSVGASKCAVLLKEINVSSLRVEVEEVVLPDRPILASIVFKNNPKAWFRLVQVSEKEADELDRLDRDEALKRLANLPVLRSWAADLPEDGDLQEHRTEIAMSGLPIGQYALVFDDTSLAAKGPLRKNTVSWLIFSVSELAYLFSGKGGQAEFLLAHRESGAPLQGVELTLYTTEYNYTARKSKRSEIRRATTNAEGLVRFSGLKGSFSVRFAKGGDVLFSEGYYANRWEDDERSEIKTHFFLDRAIYRPGQTVYFKGIVTEHAPVPGDVRILANRRALITFRDVNYKEIARQEVTTNDYGSFNGSFTAPSGTLRGAMSISSSLGGSQVAFRVEEYKRPRFEVAISPLEGQAVLGAGVSLKGSATMYAGSAVDGAKVSYRVTRTASFPWWYWWRPNPAGGETLITSGETQTDAAGNFTVSFNALPDPTLDPQTLPEFSFRIEADVTDITGETHTASQTINLGFANIRAKVAIGEWLDAAKPDTFEILTTNLDGQAVAAAGKVRFVALQGPAKPRLKRYWSLPDRPMIAEAIFRRDFPLLAFGNEDDPLKWPAKATAWETDFNTGEQTKIALPAFQLAAGYYLLVLETSDADGKPLSLRKLVKVVDSKARKIPDGEMFFADISKKTAVPGDEVTALLATADDTLHVYMDKGRAGAVNESRWVQVVDWATDATRITEGDRGNRFYLFHFIRHNRVFSDQRMLAVPWTNKVLQINYETFRDNLLPGQEEEWRLRITGPDGNAAAAEVLAAMYDASLDQFQPNQWSFGLFPTFGLPYAYRSGRQFSAVSKSVYHAFPYLAAMEKIYPDFIWFEGMISVITFEGYDMQPMARSAKRMMLSAPAPAPAMDSNAVVSYTPKNNIEESAQPTTPVSSESPAPVLRDNLRETVFFFPEIRTDKEGALILKFTMNEALTRWKFMTLAHTTDLKSAVDARVLVTQKPLMVLPNLPRFIREGDEIELSAKVTNLSGAILKGNARLELFDALSMQPVDLAFGNQINEQAFLAGDGQSAPLVWKIKVPADVSGALVVRISAAAGNFADAEENALPVLANRMQVTESVPLYVRGGSKKVFTMESLKHSQPSATLTPLRLSIEMTSNPAWLAVKALPYLIEYPYACAEQVFSRFYANAIAGNIVRNTPGLEAMFNRWRDAGSLSSRLSQNQELKSLMLEETPWVFEAQEEEQQQKNIALLFDLNNMARKQEDAVQALADMQNQEGAFPWFPGGPANRYITQHIAAGLGKLSRLGIAFGQVQAIRTSAMAYLDREMDEDYRRLMESVRDGRTNGGDNHLTPLVIHYLYTRSFEGVPPIDDAAKPAFDYYTGQARAFWNTQGVMEQGMIALALSRNSDNETPARIIASLRERALRSEELGMHWKTPRGYFWNQLPVETQSLLIELFDEVGKSGADVEEMKIWLLKQKQTNRWPSTKATADAVYALLKTRGGAQWLNNDQQVRVTFPGAAGKKQLEEAMALARKSAEPGTGYYKVRWEGKEVHPNMATVELQNPNQVIAWGGLYWQYFEQLDKIKSFEETPLTLRKRLFRETTGDQGAVLVPLDEGRPLQPGDKLIVRLELRVDRAMEFVHLKDMRASALEPVNPLSAYRWQGGLGYYESPGDLATHFFIDYLPPGTYILEYPLRVNHRGDFSGGISTAQCMYAPEFSSHTAGVRLKVER